MTIHVMAAISTTSPAINENGNGVSHRGSFAIICLRPGSSVDATAAGWQSRGFGHTARLINIMLKGPGAVLPPDRAKYSGAMPAVNVLNDAELTGVINYIHAWFAPGAAKVAPEQIAAQRAKI